MVGWMDGSEVRAGAGEAADKRVGREKLYREFHGGLCYLGPIKSRDKGCASGTCDMEV